ncbi:MAG: Sir2 family NAD-dependent protein deacetylase [Burkholderiaceae bacterium]|nr:Sir2 family NAD-dependent protein deacetylase [Burkholderiaceae bacterium]
MPLENKDIVRAASLIAEADALVIAAGAGFGVDSGLPDFRGNEGFWNAYPALGKARINFTRIASPNAFAQNPQLAWGFYGHRLALYRQTLPHHGFALLKHWSEKMKGGYTVFTSNVDGQFQKAGFDPERIHECHGSIHHLQCLAPCELDFWSADGFEPRVNEEACLLTSPLPTCPHCHGLARPNVLMFGDWSWVSSRQEAQASRQHQWLSGVNNPLVIELGAGTAVPSVRYFSQYVCRQYGGRLIRINLREPEVDCQDDLGLAVGALDCLNAIAAQLGAEWLAA